MIFTWIRFHSFFLLKKKDCIVSFYVTQIIVCHTSLFFSKIIKIEKIDKIKTPLICRGT